MQKSTLLVLTATAGLLAGALPRTSAAQTQQEIARWKREALAVTITRDDWGIAHVKGHTDAEAVFGMEYAQAEDDFNRVETNYLDALGWHAQGGGASLDLERSAAASVRRTPTRSRPSMRRAPPGSSSSWTASPTGSTTICTRTRR